MEKVQILCYEKTSEISNLRVQSWSWVLDLLNESWHIFEEEIVKMFLLHVSQFEDWFLVSPNHFDHLFLPLPISLLKRLPPKYKSCWSIVVSRKMGSSQLSMTRVAGQLTPSLHKSYQQLES